MKTVYIRLTSRFVNIRFISASYIGCVRKKKDSEFCKEDTCKAFEAIRRVHSCEVSDCCLSRDECYFYHEFRIAWRFFVRVKTSHSDTRLFPGRHYIKMLEGQFEMDELGLTKQDFHFICPTGRPC